MSRLGLPWETIDTPPAHLNNKLLEMKIINNYEWCGKEYKFLGDILEYLKMVNKDGRKINYEILKHLLKTAKIIGQDNMNKYYKFDFIQEIMQEIKINLDNNNNNGQQNKKK